MKYLISFSFVFLLAISTSIGQCSSKKKNVHYSSYNSNQSHDDIVDIASGLDDFSTLVAAVSAADLVKVLKSDGPFTVFAPTNTAFAKLPEGTVETLVKKENKSTLTSILTYHVIPAKITAETLVNTIAATGGEVNYKTVQGGILTAKIMNGNPVLIDEKGNKAFIVKTDVQGSNGIIHAIDAVVMPG